MAPPAHAAEPSREEDEHLFAPSVELRDVAPHELFATSGGKAPLWLSITAGSAELKNGSRSFDAMLLLSVPLERFARAPRRSQESDSSAEASSDSSAKASSDSSAKAIRDSSAKASSDSSAKAIAEAPALKPPARIPKPSPADAAPPTGEGASKASPGSDAAPEPAEPLPIPVIITPNAARSAVRAALKHARLEDATARVDALTSRARASALLPELRLRASRLVDEAQQLSPTEYDPGRVTASGGTSVWLEARATWRLDRLVFADEEVSIERMRHDRAEAQSKMIDRTLELLFAWQRALSLAACPGKPPEAQLLARLKVIETEAALDVLTGGWLTRWRAPTAPQSLPSERKP